MTKSARISILASVVTFCVVVACFLYWDYEWMLWVRSTPHFILYGFPNDKFEEQAAIMEDAAKSVLLLYFIWFETTLKGHKKESRK